MMLLAEKTSEEYLSTLRDLEAIVKSAPNPSQYYWDSFWVSSGDREYAAACKKWYNEKVIPILGL